MIEHACEFSNSAFFDEVYVDEETLCISFINIKFCPFCGKSHAEIWESENMYPKFDVLLGKTLSNVERIGNDELIFTLSNGSQYKLYHNQDCCESVYIEDIIGDLLNLIDEPLLMAEEVNNLDHPAPEHAESYTWTFYKLATINGFVTIRWLGESNGYYSESVDFVKIK